MSGKGKKLSNEVRTEQKRNQESSKSGLSRNTPQNKEPENSLFVSGGKRCGTFPGQEAPPSPSRTWSRSTCLTACLHSSVPSDYCAVYLKSTHHPSARVRPQVHNTRLISSWQRQQSSIYSDQTSIQGNFRLQDQRAEALANAKGAGTEVLSRTLPAPRRRWGGGELAPPLFRQQQV